MAPKDIARSYPKRGLTADVGFRSEPAFVGDGSVEFTGTNSLQFDGDHTFVNGFSVAGWYWIDGTQSFNYAGFAGTTLAWGFPSSGTYLNFYQKATSTAHQTTGGTLTPKQWNHIAFTLSQDGLTVKAYLNGVELTITQPSVAIVLPSLTNVSEAGIASFQNSASSTLPYSGQMANQIWYDGVLTQDEVRQLMRAPNYAVASTIVTPQFYFELFDSRTDSTGNATTVEDRGTVTYGVKRPQLPRGLSLTQNAAQARVYTGRAVDFDGSADYLRNSATVPSITSAGAQASICAWVNFDSASGGLRNIASFCNTSNDDGIVIYQNNAEIGVAVFNNAPTVREKALTSVSTGRWFFVVGTWDKDTASQKVYVDGVRGSGNMSSGIGIEAGTDIGARSSATPQYYFDGQIASVKYFDVELTQAQIRELYHNPEQVLPTGVSASNLRRYYPLSDYNDTGGTGGRYFQDMGADGEPAEDQGSSSMAFAQPVPCPQLGLQQSATRVYFERNATRAQATLGAAPGTTCTMSAWVMVDQQYAFQYFMKNGTNITANAFFAFAIDTNRRLYAVQSSNIQAEGSLALSDYGEWNHVVAMTKSTAPYVRFFINGVEDTSITDNGMVAFNLTSTFIEIGSDGGANHLKGFLNDCAIWDVELSDPEVAALYNSGVQGMDVSTVQSSNLKGWWKCDDLTSFKDYSGNGVNATLTASVNAASFPENASGSTIVGDFSMKRKGVSVLNPTATPLVTSPQPRAQIANDGSLNPDPANGGYTASAFIRFEMQAASATFLPTVFGNTVQPVSNKDWHLCIFAGNVTTTALKLQIGDGSTTYRNYSWPAVLSNPEQWHHIAYTIDFSTSPTTFRLYQDGALVSTQATYTHLAIDTGDMNVGTYWSGNGNFPGAIACVKMYQTKLSDNEIEQIYRSDLRLIKGLNNE